MFFLPSLSLSIPPMKLPVMLPIVLAETRALQWAWLMLKKVKKDPDSIDKARTEMRAAV